MEKRPKNFEYICVFEYLPKYAEAAVWGVLLKKSVFENFPKFIRRHLC